MKSVVSRILVCMLAVALMCSWLATPAYALSLYELLTLKQMEEEAKSDPNVRAELEQIKAEAKAIDDLIAALPEDVSVSDKYAIERAREVYDGADRYVQYYVLSASRSKLEAAESQLELEIKLSEMTPVERLGYELSNGNYSIAAVVALCVWYLLFIVQSFLAFGTAYRKAKAGGDSGVSLYGWLLLYTLAGIVPFLGIILWKRHRAAPKE